MIRNDYGMTFATEREKEAWEAYIDARLEAAEQTPEISHEEALERLKAMKEGWGVRVPHSVA